MTVTGDLFLHIAIRETDSLLLRAPLQDTQVQPLLSQLSKEKEVQSFNKFNVPSRHTLELQQIIFFFFQKIVNRSKDLTLKISAMINICKLL